MSVSDEKKKVVERKPTESQNNLTDYEMSNDQLGFFFLPEAPDKEQQYSHLMDLYDAIPRIHFGRIERLKDEEGKLLPRQTLPTRNKEFVHRNRKYTMHQIPGRIMRQNKKNEIIEEWEYYPQVREEIVEETLKKMASEGQGAFFRQKGQSDIEDQTGVVFSIYALRKEMAKHGHKYSYDEIKEALLILRRTSLSIYDESGKQMMEHNIFSAFGLSEENGRGNAFVLFNPLVTASIQSRSFRQYNYKLAMQLKLALARWFYKKLCLNYTQASRLTPYTILLTTIVRDSGMKIYPKISNNIREVEKAFNELIKKKVIASFEEERSYDVKDKRRIADVKYTIQPHDEFVKEMMRFNYFFDEQQKTVLM